MVQWVMLALGVCLTAAALAGCDETQPGASTADARLGVCHDLQYSQEVTAASDANPAVSCTSTHTVQTFAVGQVVGKFASWRTRPDQEALQSLTSTMCTVDALRAFLGAGARDSVTGVSIHAYFPNDAAWQGGSRQASCDVSVNGSGGAPRPIGFSLKGVMSKPGSAMIRTCYRQKPLPGGAWTLTGTSTTCDKPHSSQDINAWLMLSGATATQAQVTRLCSPYATQFAGSAVMKKDQLEVTGVVAAESNGTYSLHCAIGGDSSHGDITGVLLAHND
ncbi:septum formation family protein [Gryllotalpicola ginsengisoli]|uniref:septum formation family protein n=1 Tax=Gryllotalpicola ginsengisoli TaxID=444608 RepID=UPI0003B40944|nr:septum formation family protein [Gryllotalpicola ginsengisoli]